MVIPCHRCLLYLVATVSLAGCKQLKYVIGDEPSANLATTGDGNYAGMDKDQSSKSKKERSVATTGTVWSETPLIAWKYTSTKMKWRAAKAYCDELAQVQKKRWRLPITVEVLGALQNGISSSKNPAFGWVYLNQVWTAAWETAQGEEVATYVDTKDGHAQRTGTAHKLTTLCVVTTNVNGRSDVWTDEGTQLIWRDLDLIDERSRIETRCRELARQDRLPWRMPTAAELEVAVKNGIQSASNVAFGQSYLTITWSADPALTFGPEDGVAIDLRNGNRYVMGLDDQLAGVCVRPKNH